MQIMFAVVDEDKNIDSLTAKMGDYIFNRTHTTRIANQHDLEADRDGRMYICGVQVFHSDETKHLPFIPHNSVSIFPENQAEEYLLQRFLGITNWFGIGGTTFWILETKQCPKN